LIAEMFVAYYRVSTERQGRSGLGLAAQRASVAAYLAGGKRELVAEFVEVESGKGRDALRRRPELRGAIDTCKQRRAKLVIARIDRLARNVHFVSGLIESGVEFLAADMPEATKTMIQIYAVMSEWERDAISRRTREALAAAKARGVTLGATGPRNIQRANEQVRGEADAFARKLRDVIEGLRARGLSQRAIVSELNALEIRSPGGRTWHLRPLQRVIARLART
jgi:DNA invertase Pin-like site-specific DNA recombinase